MYPINHRVRRHRLWTQEADEELRRLIAAGKFLPEIARIVDRTQEACRTRANLLKLPVRSSARPRRVGVHGELSIPSKDIAEHEPEQSEPGDQGNQADKPAGAGQEPLAAG